MKKLRHLSAGAAVISLLSLEQGHAMHPPAHGKTENPSPEHTPEREYRTRAPRTGNIGRNSL